MKIYIVVTNVVNDVTYSRKSVITRVVIRFLWHDVIHWKTAASYDKYRLRDSNFLKFKNCENLHWNMHIHFSTDEIRWKVFIFLKLINKWQSYNTFHFHPLLPVWHSTQVKGLIFFLLKKCVNLQRKMHVFLPIDEIRWKVFKFLKLINKWQSYNTFHFHPLLPVWHTG